MTVADIAKVLNARFLCGEDHSGKTVHSACGSDLMSDVLAFVKDQSVLVTGITNAQAVRTAEMMDIICIVLVRGKKADAAMLNVATNCGIVILQTDHSMFTTCGLLYESGLRGGGKSSAKKAKATL